MSKSTALPLVAILNVTVEPLKLAATPAVVVPVLSTGMTATIPVIADAHVSASADVVKDANLKEHPIPLAKALTDEGVIAAIEFPP